MDTRKQLAFNERMGKRQRYAHGGRVKRIDHFDEGGRVRKVEHFDDGGAVPGTAVSGPSTSAATSTSGTTSGLNGLNGGLGIGNPTSSVGNAVGDAFPVLGIAGGALGDLQNATQNNFQASATPVQAGTNASQLNSAYNTAQGGINAQGNLVNALNQQNGIGNQSQVYNQLQGVVNGTGPNPAQAQLAQATGQNVANQGALMAGQRGAAGNVGLIARQAAQQGAATQQQAANQAATLQAGQSLNALNSAGSLASTQAGNQIGATTGLNTAAQNEQNILQSANSNLNNANVTQQSGLNNVNAQISQGNQSASNGLLGGMLNGGSSLISSILAKGGLVGRDGKKVIAITHHAGGSRHHYDDGGSVDFGTDYAAVPSEPSPSIGAVGTSPDEGSALAAPSGKSGGGALAALMAGGGSVNYSGNYASIPSGSSPSVGSMGKSPDEGSALQAVNYNQKKSGSTASTMPSTSMGTTSSMGNGLGDMASNTPGGMMAARGGKICKGPHASHVANYMYAKGGNVPAMVSPGERYLAPSDVKRVIEQGENPLKLGTEIPGKAKKPGDSLKNDVVPKTLEEGGVVLPRHITKKKDPDKASLFVHRSIHMKKPGGK